MGVKSLEKVKIRNKISGSVRGQKLKNGTQGLMAEIILKFKQKMY